MNFKNITDKIINMNLDGEWVTIEPQELINIPFYIGSRQPGLTPDSDSMIKELIKQTEEVIVEVIEEPEVKEPEVKEPYTYTDLKDMKKSEQVKILSDMGLSKEQIKFLKTEDSRIKKIMELE